MADRLPQEVLIDILTRLSIEDLVRCITVSKSWYSLITSPNFISFHIKQTSANTTNNRLLLIRELGPYSDKSHIENYSLRYDNDTFEVYKRLDFTFKSTGLYPYLRIIGCVNGVVCLSDDAIGYMDVLVLWNPSIKKFVTLPKPPVTYNSHGPFKHAIGFGFNTVTNDYKVVRAVSLLYEKDWLPPIFEVYDSSAGYWRIIDSKGFNYGVVHRSSQTFLNGAIHWVGYKCHDSDKECTVIVSFDLGNEVLGVMKLLDTMPALPWRESQQFYKLSVLGGSLSLIQQDSGMVNRSCIWVMKQYGLTDSWTKLFTVDLPGGLKEVFGYRNNGEALLSLSTFGGTAMASYDSNSKQLKYLEEFQCRDRSFNVENFVESLSLLGVKGEPMMKAADNFCSQQKEEEEGKEEGAEEEVQKKLLRKSTKTGCS